MVRSISHPGAVGLSPAVEFAAIEEAYSGCLRQNEYLFFSNSLVDFCRVIAVIPGLLVVHVMGLVFWVSGLLVTSMALTRHTQEAAAEARDALARLERIYLRGLADPGALLTLLAGAGLIMTNSHYYLHAPWLHIKLTFVLLLIGLHGLVAMRTKAFATGRIALQRTEARMLVLATLFLFLSILIATLVGQVYLT